MTTIKVSKQASWMEQQILSVVGNIPHHIQLHRGKDNCSLIKQLYLQQLGSLPKVEWKDIMVKNLARPKAIFSMWLIIHERMMTTDRLLKWNINMDPLCAFCKLPETHAHLLCKCIIISGLWKDAFNWLQLQVQLETWAQLVTWFVEKAKKKSVEGRLM